MGPFVHRPHLRGGRVGSVRADFCVRRVAEIRHPFFGTKEGLLYTGGPILHLRIYGHPISRRGVSDQNSLRLYLSLEVVACNMRPEPVQGGVRVGVYTTPEKGPR